MKIKFLLIISALFLLTSCLMGDAFPQIENITNGKKWTLEIDSTPSEVYEQLQELSLEKQFNSVSIIYRQLYNSPEDIQADISLYNSISLKKTSGVLERILITFDEDKVSHIEKGGGLLNNIHKWPENQPNNISINIGDSVHLIKEKLIAIYQIPTYNEYKLQLPDKVLAKPFDVDMEHYDEWFFTFSEKVSSKIDGRNTVRLYFNNRKLVKINNTYEEFDFEN
jgi:hypothetical protein